MRETKTSYLKRISSEKRILDAGSVSYISSKFINRLMLDGKRSKAQLIFNQLISKLQRDTGEHGMDVIIRAVQRVRPALEVKSVRVGSSYYQVPFEIDIRRQVSLAVKWIVDSARSRSGKGILDKISSEILSASHSQGNAYKKKIDVHKTAESNRMFVHFRW